MPSADDYQQQIVRECSDPNQTLAALVSTLWDLHAAKADTDPSLLLQYLYTKRSALDIRLAEEQPSTDFAVEGDVRDRQSERFAHLQQMRADCQAEIVRIEAQVSSTQGPASGCIAQTALSRPAFGGQPNAAAAAYRGSPYVRPPRPT
jgi:hypothetical protein